MWSPCPSVLPRLGREGFSASRPAVARWVFCRLSQDRVGPEELEAHLRRLNGSWDPLKWVIICPELARSICKACVWLSVQGHEAVCWQASLKRHQQATGCMQRGGSMSSQARRSRAAGRAAPLTPPFSLASSPLHIWSLCIHCYLNNLGKTSHSLIMKMNRVSV